MVPHCFMNVVYYFWSKDDKTRDCFYEDTHRIKEYVHLYFLSFCFLKDF